MIVGLEPYPDFGCHDALPFSLLSLTPPDSITQ
jgi:hypothetical protein